MSVTYQRAKPCVKCGGHEFYIASKSCKPCANTNAKQCWQRNSAAYVPLIKAWRKKNKDYISLYRKSRYQMKKDAMPAIFAFYLMTRGVQ